MATIASRLANTGTLLVNGIFDEVTYTGDSTFASRTTANTIYTTGFFDEVTGMSSTRGLIFYVDFGKTATYPGFGTRVRDIANTTIVGTTQASPTYTSTAPGYFTFNGTTNYIDFGDNKLAEQQDKTVTAWIYVTSTLSDVAGIIDKEYDNGVGNSGGWGFWVGPITGGNGLWFWPDRALDLKDTTVLSLNTWYHVAVVYSYSGKSATFYVNGAVKTTQSNVAITENPSNSTTLKIGAIRTIVNHFPGRIGAVQVYNRQLSAGEVLNNYNAEASRYGYTPTTTVPVKRESNTAIISVADQFDEFTGAPVIDSSLKLWLDAAQTPSYNGSGSTWTDLSPSASNITLYGSPTYSDSVNGGRLQFVPASTQYGLSTANLGNMPTWTVEAWVRVTASLTGQVTSVVTNQYDLSTSLNYSIGTNNSPTNYNLCVGFFDGSWHNTLGVSPTLNTWFHIVGTYDGSTLTQYNNGSVTGSTLSYSGTPSSGGVTRIARRWDDTTASTNLFPGDISVVRIYNRALTADEVSQNFNALRNRYGI